METKKNNTSKQDDDDDTSLIRLEKCVTLLKNNGVKVVVFDMDLTAVAEHSRGCLKRIELESYLDRATPAFQKLIPILNQNKFGLAIATHSDEAEFAGEIQPSTHILGHELATALIERHFPPSICETFQIVAYNPRVHPNDDIETNKIKRYHLKKIQDYFNVQSPQEIIFFDDTLPVVTDCIETIGIRAIHVNHETGFCIQDLISYFEEY